MLDAKQETEVAAASHATAVRVIDFFQLAYDRMLESGATDVSESDLLSVQNHAAAVARETHQGKYDPENNPADAARDDEYKKVLKDRAKLEEPLRYSDADCRETNATLSQKHEAGPKPAPHPALLVLSLLLIAITMTPTISDRFLSGIADDIGRLSLAGILGLIFGGAAVALILYGHGERGQRPGLSYGGFAVALLFALACGGIRYSMASTTQETIFAVFLAGLETAVLIYLEIRAAALRHELKEWWERKDVEGVAKRARDASREERDRIRALIEECNRKIEAHIAYVTSRKPRFNTAEEAEAAAVQQATDGTYAGAARNRGLLLGAGRAS